MNQMRKFRTIFTYNHQVIQSRMNKKFWAFTYPQEKKLNFHCNENLENSFSANFELNISQLSNSFSFFHICSNESTSPHFYYFSYSLHLNMIKGKQNERWIFSWNKKVRKFPFHLSWNWNWTFFVLLKNANCMRFSSFIPFIHTKYKTMQNC